MARPVRGGLRAHSSQELRLLAEAGAALLGATIAVKLFPFRHTARCAGLIAGAAGEDATTAQLAAAKRVGWAVRTVAERTPWTSTCLAQAVAAAALLGRRQIPGHVQFGVAKDAAQRGGLSAHAWLSCGGHVLTGDGPQRERHTVVGVYSVGGTRARTRRESRQTS